MAFSCCCKILSPLPNADGQFMIWFNIMPLLRSEALPHSWLCNVILHMLTWMAMHGSDKCMYMLKRPNSYSRSMHGLHHPPGSDDSSTANCIIAKEPASDVMGMYMTSCYVYGNILHENSIWNNSLFPPPSSRKGCCCPSPITFSLWSSLLKWLWR